jgi:hypothetical protein
MRRRRAALIAVLYFVLLLVAAAASTPRRVGDGGEYVVMAWQLAAGHRPSLDAEELQAAKQQLATLGSGFESSLLDYPALVGRDGRQDFLHFFLYPLTVAPAVPVVSWLGLHPNWAFTIVNALVLAGAAFAVAARAPLVATVAGFVSPIIWWVDKAHTEAFLFAAVSVAAVLWRHQPALALMAYALAGAQNAALGLTYPLFAFLLWKSMRGAALTRRVGIAMVAGALLVALPYLYTWMRLGRWSVMADYAQRTIPSVAGMAAFVIEPNIGLLPSAPVYAIALGAGVWLLVRTIRRRTSVTPIWWWPAVIHVVLIAIWSQNPNANHGGTPGVNRWTLSLLAMGLPWIGDARQLLGPGGRIALNIVVAITAVMTAAAHRPAQAENYREPTTLAMQMWQAGWVHVTPAEVFAERTQGREPAFAPSHDGSCRVLLIANQQAPVQCAPPTEPLPSWCRYTDALCYAVSNGETARYVRAPMNGFFYRAAEPSWPAGGPLALGIHRVLRAADPTVRVWRVESPRRWRERLTDASIGVVLTSPEVTVIHITRLSDSARRTIASDPNVRVVPLIPSAGASEDAVALSNLAVIIRRRAGA